MKQCTTVDEALQWSRRERGAGQRIGFVPTLGCLHEGHATLLRRARAENDRVALSVFVNPFQFKRDKFGGYPRALDQDLELARDEGVDLIFTPEPLQLYPGAPSLDALFALQAADEATREADEFVGEEPFGPGRFTHVRVPRALVERMDGGLFPWHFDAVATVVARLFETLEPDVAYFGEKDPQQLAILRRLAAWLPRRVEIRPVPVVRDSDGMPSSSRNTLLSESQRRVATAAPAALAHGAELLRSGQVDGARLCAAMRAMIEAQPGIAVDYLGVVDPLTLEPVAEIGAEIGAEVLLFVSYFVGEVRLTDCRIERRIESVPS